MENAPIIQANTKQILEVIKINLKDKLYTSSLTADTPLEPPNFALRSGFTPISKT